MLTKTFLTLKSILCFELPFEFEFDFSIHKNPNVLPSLGTNKGIILAHPANWLRHWIGNGCFRDYIQGLHVSFNIEKSELKNQNLFSRKKIE